MNTDTFKNIIGDNPLIDPNINTNKVIEELQERARNMTPEERNQEIDRLQKELKRLQSDMQSEGGSFGDVLRKEQEKERNRQ